MAPKCDEPPLRDRDRPINGLYTPARGEGALPDGVVVIPDTTESMYIVEQNNNIFDLYSIGGQNEKELGETSVPFVHGVELSGPRGEKVRFRSVFDDGALANAIDERMYLTSKNRLSALKPSARILKMADGRLVPSLGVWTGQVTVKGVSRIGTFQVLNSNGAWALLFGKPLLEAFNAIHDYSRDIITLPQGKEWVSLENQFASRKGILGDLLANLTVDIKQLVDISGDGKSSPLREVSDNKTYDQLAPNELPETVDQEVAKIEEVIERTERGADCPNAPEVFSKDASNEGNNLWLLDNPLSLGIEQPDVSRNFEPTLLTRKTAPHNPARVKAILDEITVGQDLTLDQRDSVRQLISQYAECFALSMSEVTAVAGATLCLDIPRDKQFRTKINQRPQSPPQKEFFNGVINKMLAADILYDR
jgi:hypothetical protein